MTHRAALPILAAFLTLEATPGAMPAAAQEASGSFAGGALGFGHGTMEVGEASDSEGGLLLAGQFGTSRSGYRRWFLDLGIHLFEVPNPVIDERYRAVSVMVHRSFGSRLFVAPAVGLVVRSWAGPEKVEDFDMGPALGVSAGAPLRLGDGLLLVPEAVWRASSIELEGDVEGRLLALRVALLWMPS